MSETVHYKGKLKEVELLEGETFEMQCKRILGVESLGGYDSYSQRLSEAIHDDLYKKYLLVGKNKLYEVLELNEHDPDEDKFLINDDLSFEVRYYNGGCSFNEAIDNAFENRNGKGDSYEQ